VDERSADNQRWADVFSAPAYNCRGLNQEQKSEFAVTRLRSGPREMEKAPQYPADPQR